MSVQGVIRPWEANPYQLISWWDMQKFSAHAFFQMARWMEAFSLAKGLDDFRRIAADAKQNPGKTRELCAQIGLELSVRQFDRVKDALNREDFTPQDIVEQVKIAQGRIQDEMEAQLFFHVSLKEAEFYEPKEPLFGAIVEAKWPRLIEDISEAGKCMALGRYTASVFHMMRVMEVGVQDFGTTLGVPLATNKAWGNILSEAKAPLSQMPSTDPRKKVREEAWAHLDSVRIAWRNEVMHPKQTYTMEEATEVFNHVRTYMRHLVSVV